MVRTNATRLLDASAIPYRTAEYGWDEEHLDASHAADALGVEREKVFKTIVMINSDKRLLVFCLPSDFSVSLKKARALTGSKEIDLLPTAELRKHTGYIRGGCSPLGMTRKYPVFIEETALLEDEIYVSAGERGKQIIIAPENLRAATDALFADFV